MLLRECHAIFISFVYIVVSLILIFSDYPDSRLSGLFTEVPTSPDNRGSTVKLLLLA